MPFIVVSNPPKPTPWDRHPAACDAYTYVPTPLSDAQLALWYPNTLPSGIEG